MISPASLKSFSSELKKIAKAQPALTKEDVKALKREVELYDKLEADSHVKVKLDSGADAHGGAYFDQQAKEIGLSRKDYESLAHELGHAELDKNIFGQAIQHPVTRTSFYMSPALGLAGGALAGAGSKSGLLLPVLGVAPTLLSEHLATREGRKKLEGLGATPDEVKKYEKSLGESGSSYLVPAAATALGTLGGYTFMRALR